MKKNKMMRLASVMMVMTLMTTSVISGTFAKYTTQDSGSDAARVAKWGVELQVVGNLYGESYKHNIVADNDGNLTVQAKDYATLDDDVVAPGTVNASGLAFSMNGVPEVDGIVKTTISYENIYLNVGHYGVMVKIPDGVVTAESYSQLGTIYFKSGDQYIAEGAFNEIEKNNYYTLEDDVDLTANYYPVEYQVAGTKANYNLPYDKANSEDTLAGAVGMLTTYFGSALTTTTDAGKTTITTSKEFATNTNLADEFKIQDAMLKWKWDFCQQDGCPDGDGACGLCKADTILGNLMAGTDLVGVVVKETSSAGTFAAPVEAKGTEAGDYNLQTGFSIDITVTQVD